MTITLNLQAGTLIQQLRAHKAAIAGVQNQLRQQIAFGPSAPVNARFQLQNLGAVQRQLSGQINVQRLLQSQGGGGSVGGSGGRLNYAIARAVGGGGRFAPLIARLLGSLGKLFLPILLAVAGITLFIHALQEASKVLHEWSQTFWKSGANQQGASSVNAIASALGLSPGQVAGDAGKRAGGSAQFLSQVKAMLGIKDDKQAFYMARAMGLEDYLPLRDLSKKQQAEALSGQGYGYNAGDRKAGTQFNAEWSKVVNAFQHGIVTIMIPAMKAVTPWFKVLALHIGLIGKAIGLLIRLNPLLLLLAALAKWLGLDKDMKKDIDKFGDAVNDFSKAVGVYGGLSQDRAKGAYPQAWAWYGVQQHMMNDARYVGAFTH